MENKVKKADEEKQASEKKSELLDIENRELKTKISDLESEAGTSGGEMRDKLRNCLAEVEELKAKLVTSKQVEDEAKENASKWLNETKETQEKYDGLKEELGEGLKAKVAEDEEKKETRPAP